MPSICFYFQVHQPYRLKPYRVLDIAQHSSYFDEEHNRKICKKVAEKCYLPANKVMLDLIKQYPGYFKIAYSISGVALEQFAEYAPEVLKSFQDLVATGQVELISETYYHSLSAVFDGNEFREQVKKHQETVAHYFNGYKPKVFRNTELIYSDGIADMVAEMGYEAMITEGIERVLGDRSPNFVYHAKGHPELALLLKNYKLSDDIAFRFSQESWEGWPLTADKFAHWVHQAAGNADTVNLFMDYETIGEHQWEATGIFDFFKSLPGAVRKHPDFDFATPSEATSRYPKRGEVSVPTAISWADNERDLSAWLGNPMQDSSIAWLYKLSKAVKKADDPHLLHVWRKLQTSDHFYYMCTKHWADGDVHKYFSAHNTPHEPFQIMSNVLTDLEIKVKPFQEKPLKRARPAKA